MYPSDPGPKRLLIVEDDDAVREAVACQFRKRADYEVREAASAGEALEAFGVAPSDVVLIDIQLPDLSGIELVSRLKELRPAVRPIMMSGWADIQDTVKALRAGAVDFFQKPFKMEEVLASVEQAFQAIAAAQVGRPVHAYLIEERRVFRIPNDFSIIPHVISDILRSLEGDFGINKSELDGVQTALHEMMINAIEHGNLGITYEEKSRLLETPSGLHEEFERRAQDPSRSGRRVTVVYQETPEAVTVRIADEGEGFDHASLPDPTQPYESRHGRGILITRVFMDEVRFNEAGNEVTLVKYKKPRRKTQPA